MNSWLKQPGSIKKLQLSLALSIVANVFFIFNSIPKKETPKITNIAPTQTTASKSISQSKVRSFIREYFASFFKIDMASISYIEKNSSEDLFKFTLKKQFELRAKNNIESNFNLINSFIEEIEENLFEVIVVGKESFTDPSYQSREITMFLEIKFQEDLDKLIVQSIPRFEVK